MNVPIRYAFSFGKCDTTDWIPGTVDLTQEEAATYADAVSRGDALEDVAELEDALQRAADAIEEEQPLDDGVDLFVEFADPV